MSNTLPGKDEFFIGWLPDSPPSFATATQRFTFGAFILLIMAAFSWVWFQKPLGTGNFEFGNIIILEGVLHKYPVPVLQITASDQYLPAHQSVLLVSFGKFGAGKTLEQMESRLGTSLNGKRIRLAGTLIYGDGKAAFEIYKNPELSGLLYQTPITDAELYKPDTVHRTATLLGEITDPKCLFGVMKPGEGKTHLDCAVRCISGGIPPVLKVCGVNGENEYYILVGPSGETVNAKVLPFVGDGVQVCGKVVQLGDWLYLFTDITSLQRVSQALLKPMPRCQ